MKFRDDILNKQVSEGGGKPRLKLKDGETATGIFRGEFHLFYQNWPNGGVKTVQAEPFPGGQFRFEINFVVKEGTGYTPKVFEGGLKLYKQLADLHKEYDLPVTVFKISRSGTDKQTTYTFMPAKAAPSAETLKYLDTLELVSLGSAPAKAPVKNYAPGASDEPEF